MSVTRIDFLLLLCCLSACSIPAPEQAAPATLFRQLTPEATGIDFRNDLTYTEEFNVYTYRNFYNGAGVGIADINNDGLLDLFFCGNQVDNKLYLNKGNFQFEDVTAAAGVASASVWTTGVSFADVNSDGWMDIYLSKSGAPGGENRHNELFINQQNGTFKEEAKAWNIADEGLSNHAAFFDYDRDGDLDCYLLNNSFRSIGNYDLRKNQRTQRDTLGGNKLYRNDGRNFTDVSEQAGIYGSSIGFGLGVSIADVNRDGWPDIFVSNDFFERDYLYLNQRNGTFAEQAEQSMPELSLSSMGADIADLNNDGYPEVFVTDMLPASNERYKTKTTFDTWDKQQLNQQQGYHRQFTRNALHLNTSSSGSVTFAESSRLAGVEATDWSWGALMADFDLDGTKDIFVANGIFKDLTDQDYLHFYNDPRNMKKMLAQGNDALQKVVDAMPSEAIANYAFMQVAPLQFENHAQQWGLAEPGFSNGSAYGDLDNDGDLDLVVSNVNAAPFVYENQLCQQQPNRHYLKLRFIGPGKNTFGIGTQAVLHQQEQRQYLELHPQRGFQSSVAPELLFAVTQKIDSLELFWPNGKRSVLHDLPSDTTLTLRYSELPKSLPAPTALAATNAVFASPVELPQATHRENTFSDFDRDRLLMYMYSADGPALAAADVNNDGLSDLYLGGAKGYSGKFLLQQRNGSFLADSSTFVKAAIAEDTDAIFFDADGDGDEDLLVASGGNELPPSAPALQDRLYLNNGSGSFSPAQNAFSPPLYFSTGTLSVADIDADGDLDLFAGERLKPFNYGVPVSGHIYQNNGSGKFTEITTSAAPALAKSGFFTGSAFADVNADGQPDLITCGDWSNIRIFINSNGSFTEATESFGLGNSSGLWQTLAIADVNADGFPDIIAGNQGLNTRLRASEQQPLSLLVADFDRNGTAEQIMSAYSGGTSYPLHLRHDLIKQLPGLKKRYLHYHQYANQTADSIFPASQRNNSFSWQAAELKSTIFINQGGKSFKQTALPVEAQSAPVWAILPLQLPEDKRPHLLLAGNTLRIKPELGSQLGSYGTLLAPVATEGVSADFSTSYTALAPAASGLHLNGEVRGLQLINTAKGMAVAVARNNQPLLILPLSTTSTQ